MIRIYLTLDNSLLSSSLLELFEQSDIPLVQAHDEADVVLYSLAPPLSPLPAIDLSTFSRPFKFGDLLAALHNLPYQQEIHFAHCALDLRERTLKNQKTNEIQRLTEKECQLLTFFHKNKGKDLSKEVLLNEIWEYHPDAQTHTLETHIYRLRQKIESDPNLPEILLNGKEGYILV